MSFKIWSLAPGYRVDKFINSEFFIAICGQLQEARDREPLFPGEARSAVDRAS